MFTKKDYIRYFEEISRVERKMIYLTNEMISKLKDEKVINALRRIAADEAKHYSFVLDLLATHLDLHESQNRRLSGREHALGLVDLKVIEGSQKPGSEFQGYCSNLSKTGMCFESAQSFEPGDNLLLKVKLYDSPDPALEHKGSVVWMRKIMDFYIGGIAFDA